MGDAMSAVFFSYSREDDLNSRGRIAALAEAVVQEYSLNTGTELALFIDRDSIAWGDEWRKRINDALDTSTAFVPVLTPRYFMRPECRREFLHFYGPAKAGGVTRLIMPIRFVPIADFDEDNADELISIASRFNYADWVDLRLSDPKSELVARAVHAMAARIEDVLRTVHETQAALVPLPSSQVAEDEGILDVIARVRSILPEWMEAVQASELYAEQGRAIVRTINARWNRARTQGQRLAVIHQQAVAEEPIIRRLVEITHTYSRLTLELHPLVAALVRLMREYPEHVDLVRELRDAVQFSVGLIDDYERQPGVELEDYWAGQAHLGKLMKELSEISRDASRYRVEANELVLGWAAELSALPA